jgi:hypothetical protein
LHQCRERQRCGHAIFLQETVLGGRPGVMQRCKKEDRPLLGSSCWDRVLEGRWPVRFILLSCFWRAISHGLHGVSCQYIAFLYIFWRCQNAPCRQQSARRSYSGGCMQYIGEHVR